MSGSIFLDTNLLILLVVGTVDKCIINKHKRTNTFTQNDFDILVTVLSGFDSILVTQAVLAETSNLVTQYGEPDRSKFLVVLGEIISSIVEIYIPSKDCLNDHNFVRFGLTDNGILEVMPEQSELITDDLNLYIAAVSKGIFATNFNHLREESLLS